MNMVTAAPFVGFGPSNAPDGGASYPIALTLTNPDAETGDTTGWIQTVGSNFTVATANIANRGTGAYYFLGSSDDAVAEAEMTPVNVPSAAESDIDAGQVMLTFEYVHADLSSDTDSGWGSVHFYSGANGTGDWLGQRTSPRQYQEDQTGVDPPTDFSRDVPVPVGTRSIKVVFVFERQGGTQLSYYFDDIALTLTKPYAGSETLFAEEDGVTSGWTIITGSDQPAIETGWSRWGWGGMRCTTGQAAWEGYRDITPSAAALTAIAAGNATVQMFRRYWNQNDDDQARVYIECLDSGDSVLDTLEDAASPTTWCDSQIFHSYSGSLAVPTGTVKFRLGIEMARIDGTALDAAIGFLNAFVKWT